MMRSEVLIRFSLAQNEERLRLGSLGADHGLVIHNKVGELMDHNNLCYGGFKPLLEKSNLAD